MIDTWYLYRRYEDGKEIESLHKTSADIRKFISGLYDRDWEKLEELRICKESIIGSFNNDSYDGY